MIDLDDIRQDIFDISKVPKVFYVYRGDTFELDLDLTISSSELNAVVLNCDGLPEATPLTLLESANVSSKWHLVLNKTQTLILAPKNHNFTITIVRRDGTELTLYKGIMTVNNRVHSNYSNNYYVATLLKQTVPTITDNDYLIGTMWVNVLTNRVYVLTSIVNDEANWLDYSDQLDVLQNDLTLLDGRVSIVENDLTLIDGRVDSVDNTKQDKLIAGENITINPNTNVISAIGGSNGNNPDGVTIVLNEDNKLEVSTVVLDDIESRVPKNEFETFKTTNNHKINAVENGLQIQIDEMEFVVDITLVGNDIKVEHRDGDITYIPVNEAVESGYYDANTEELVLELANGNEVRIPAGDIVAGLASVDYVDTGLALKENKSNKITELVGVPNNTQYMSAKLTNDLIMAARTEFNSMLDGKQDKLIAGDNITIDENNVISASSEGNSYDPDGVTIVLNEDNELEVNLKHIMDGGYL